MKSDKAGRIKASFVAPEDFGFQHDIVVQQGNRLLTQTAFHLDMTVRLTGPSSGPIGTPIAIEVTGIGWRELEGSWVLLYDNKFTGFMSVVTTGGTARFDLPATGHVGRHIIEIQHSDFGSPYRNTQQSPVPDRPVFHLTFTITPGDPVLPPPAAAQAQTQVRSLPPQGDLVATPAFAGVGAPVIVRGGGFEPGKVYELNWNTVVGNRMSGRGWEEKAKVVAQARADAAGQRGIPLRRAGRPRRRASALGRCRRHQETGRVLDCADRLPARRRCAARSGPPSASISRAWAGARPPTSTPWSTTTATSGYACAFNSQGDVEIFLQATGEPGWHFIDLYPGDLQGQGDAAQQLPPAATDLCGRPPGRGSAALPLRLRGHARHPRRPGPAVGVRQ